MNDTPDWWVAAESALIVALVLMWFTVGGLFG